MPNASSNYPTDLSDAQWNLLHPLLPGPSPTGRPRTCNLRHILNGIFGIAKQVLILVRGRVRRRIFGR